MSIKCATCQKIDNFDKSVYYDNRGVLLGEWPLYYTGAGPNHPQDADAYFCNVDCAHKYFNEK